LTISQSFGGLFFCGSLSVGRALQLALCSLVPRRFRPAAFHGLRRVSLPYQSPSLWPDPPSLRRLSFLRCCSRWLTFSRLRLSVTSCGTFPRTALLACARLPLPWSCHTGRASQLAPSLVSCGRRLCAHCHWIAPMVRGFLRSTGLHRSRAFRLYLWPALSACAKHRVLRLPGSELSSLRWRSSLQALCLRLPLPACVGRFASDFPPPASLPDLRPVLRPSACPCRLLAACAARCFLRLFALGWPLRLRKAPSPPAAAE